MVRIYIFGRENIGWSIDKDHENVKSFLLKLNVRIVKNIFKADIIFCVWSDQLLSKLYFFYFLINLLKIVKKTKLISVITNDITIDNSKFRKLIRLVDLWIAPNKKILNYVKHLGLRVELIPFYVDKEIFKEINLSREEISNILNINYNKIKNKFLIGSFQRDSLGKNLDKPKWQKNPDLLIKILRHLPKNKIMLILAGPRRHYIINQCKLFDIPYLFIGNENYIEKKIDDFLINNLSDKKISLLYNLINLYIITSKSESGPKAVMEAALSKTLILSTPVGIAPDVLDRELIFTENDINRIVNFIDDLIELKIKSQNYTEKNYKIITNLLDENKLIKRYRQVLRRCINQK